MRRISQALARHVASAFLFQEERLEELQKVVDKSSCDVHGLSMRTAKLFLYLPLSSGGGGADARVWY